MKGSPAILNQATVLLADSPRALMKLAELNENTRLKLLAERPDLLDSEYIAREDLVNVFEAAYALKMLEPTKDLFLLAIRGGSLQMAQRLNELVKINHKEIYLAPAPPRSRSPSPRSRFASPQKDAQNTTYRQSSPIEEAAVNHKLHMPMVQWLDREFKLGEELSLPYMVLNNDLDVLRWAISKSDPMTAEQFGNLIEYAIDADPAVFRFLVDNFKFKKANLLDAMEDVGDFTYKIVQGKRLDIMKWLLEDVGVNIKDFDNETWILVLDNVFRGQSLEMLQYFLRKFQLSVIDISKNLGKFATKSRSIRDPEIKAWISENFGKPLFPNNGGR